LKKSRRNIDVGKDTWRPRIARNTNIKMRNQVKGLVRKAKANMERKIAKNAKKFWQYANSKWKTKSGISELKYKKENGEEDKTSTDKKKAEVLANFFSIVFTNEPDGEIPNIEPITIFLASFKNNNTILHHQHKNM
jgi:hypothetical protein